MPTEKPVATDEGALKAAREAAMRETMTGGSYQEVADAAITAYLQSAPTSVPAGYVLVPREPTEEMEEAQYAAHSRASTIFADFKDVWRAILAAAPSVEAGGEEQARDTGVRAGLEAAAHFIEENIRHTPSAHDTALEGVLRSFAKGIRSLHPADQPAGEAEPVSVEEMSPDEIREQARLARAFQAGVDFASANTAPVSGEAVAWLGEYKFMGEWRPNSLFREKPEGPRYRNIVPLYTHSSPAALRDEEREQLLDKIDGLQSDLDAAVEVAFRRGATEWTRLNYPKIFAALSPATTGDA